MVTEIANLGKRSVQTTVSLPLNLYIQLIKRTETEHMSLSEIVRRALYKELEGRIKQDENANSE